MEKCPTDRTNVSPTRKNVPPTGKMSPDRKNVLTRKSCPQGNPADRTLPTCCQTAGRAPKQLQSFQTTTISTTNAPPNHTGRPTPYTNNTTCSEGADSRLCAARFGAHLSAAHLHISQPPTPKGADCQPGPISPKQPRSWLQAPVLVHRGPPQLASPVRTARSSSSPLPRL